jgi:heme exporter protein C
MLAALYGAFIHAPREQTMGDLQRIFYFHVASWWVAGLAIAVVFGASVAYLLTRDRRYDTLAFAAAEVVVLFTTVGLTMGTLWAKPAWGIFWTWDARLTTALVLWLIFVSYLMLRHFVPDEDRRAKLAAVVAILGFLDIPIVWMSIRWWRTQHPAPVMMGDEKSGLDPIMAQGFAMCLVGFSFLFLYLLERRMALERSRQEVDSLFRQLEGA